MNLLTMNNKIYLPLTEKMFYFDTIHTVMNQSFNYWWPLRIEIDRDLRREITNFIDDEQQN